MKFLKAIALMIVGLLPLVMTVASGSAATVTFDWALTSNATPMNGGFPLLGAASFPKELHQRAMPMASESSMLTGPRLSALAPSRSFPAPSWVLACPASSWRAVAFSPGGDGGGRKSPELPA